MGSHQGFALNAKQSIAFERNFQRCARSQVTLVQDFYPTQIVIDRIIKIFLQHNTPGGYFY